MVHWELSADTPDGPCELTIHQGHHALTDADVDLAELLQRATMTALTLAMRTETRPGARWVSMDGNLH